MYIEKHHILILLALIRNQFYLDLAHQFYCDIIKQSNRSDILMQKFSCNLFSSFFYFFQTVFIFPASSFFFVHLCFISLCVVRHVCSYHLILLMTTSAHELVLLIQIQLSESLSFSVRKSSSNIKKHFAWRHQTLILKVCLRAAKFTEKQLGTTWRNQQTNELAWESVSFWENHTPGPPLR